ncbi:Ankyrin repeat-containing protein ITN1 [Linum perenne]
MGSRRNDSPHLGRSPSIKSCFPDTKSTEGSEYRSDLRSAAFHLKSHSCDVRDRNFPNFSPMSTSLALDRPTNMVMYDNALYSNPMEHLGGSSPFSTVRRSLEVHNQPRSSPARNSEGYKVAGFAPVLTLQASNENSALDTATSDISCSPLVEGAMIGDKRFKGHPRHVPLYLAALKGDWRTAKAYLQWHPTAIRAYITRGLETALHIAAGARHTVFVRKLVKKMTPDDLSLQNKVGNTALCFAAVAGLTEIAKVLVNKNRHLPLIRGSKGATPLYMAVLLGKRDMVWYLYSVTNDNDLSGEDRIGLLVAAITSDLFDFALALLRNHPELGTARDANGESALHVLSRKPGAFYSGTRLSLWRNCIYKCVQMPFMGSSGTIQGSYLGERIVRVPDANLIYYMKLSHYQALELAKRLWDLILQLDNASVKEFIRTPTRLLFTATELGMVEFVTVLIRSYPDLIWKVDDHSRSIFHTAVVHRREKVFSLINEIGALKDFIAIYKDEEDNNMLHLVGKLPHASRLNSDSGAALQLRREILWFKEVERIVQPLYTEMKNADGKTPHDLFSTEHKKLARDGEKWMKETASSCMVVATLITTMMFAAAFTVPGGNNQETGKPLYLKTETFLIFAISDALALVSSATSILIFLSILTSRYAEEDFLSSLPNKLLTGLLTLFISIATMMMAFSSTLFMTLGYGYSWATISITAVACVPVSIYAVLQFRLVADIVSHSYTTSIFFHPKNCLLG